MCKCACAFRHKGQNSNIFLKEYFQFSNAAQKPQDAKLGEFLLLIVHTYSVCISPKDQTQP